MSSFASADVSLSTHLILLANDETWKKPAWVVALLKEGLAYTAINDGWTEADTAPCQETPDTHGMKHKASRQFQSCVRKRRVPSTRWVRNKLRREHRRLKGCDH